MLMWCWKRSNSLWQGLGWLLVTSGDIWGHALSYTFFLKPGKWLHGCFQSKRTVVNSCKLLLLFWMQILIAIICKVSKCLLLFVCSERTPGDIYTAVYENCTAHVLEKCFCNRTTSSRFWNIFWKYLWMFLETFLKYFWKWKYFGKTFLKRFCSQTVFRVAY